MRRFTAFAAVALLSLAARALPNGPFVLAGTPLGASRSATSGGATTTVGPLFGPHLQAGWEVGEHLNSQFSLVLGRAGGPATHSQYPEIDFSVGIRQYAVGYQLSWDVLGKRGFTPYVGAGFYLGRAAIDVTGSSAGVTAFESGATATLELHAVAGVRWGLPNGLGLRAELAASTYGGLGTVIASLGAGWTLGR